MYEVCKRDTICDPKLMPAGFYNGIMRRARLPTRVNNACDRCRRQKQRCDEFRPCSNCLHTRSDCLNSDLPPPTKKPRFSRASEPQTTNSSPEGGLAHLRPASNVDGLQSESSLRLESSTSDAELLDRAASGQRYASFGGPDERSHEPTAFADLGGSESAVDITKKILGATKYPSADRATFAIPGGDWNRRRDSSSTQGRFLPIHEIIGVDLPAREVSDALVDTYFCTVHWFSLVLYEPKFRLRYVAILDSGLARPSDRAFLLLLLMVLVMGCWYGPGMLPPEIASRPDLNNARRDFLKLVTQSFMDLIDEDCLEFVQLSVLLGSYWLYWGRPRSSFSILGAATKSAQAIELHRDCDKCFTVQDAEERKRVWWTIYTWDRFATIVYGRPLGINDKDCNISMPASYPEDISFISGSGPARVSLSPYQIQLNRAYQITSPLLENIYGFRYSTDRSLRSQMPSMVVRIDQLLQAWQEGLPPHLQLDKYDDITPASNFEEKMHRLQALSLQMTYDNLMIVIHRFLLADQNKRRSRPRNTDRTSIQISAESAAEAQYVGTENNFKQCLNSALRISKIQQNKRNLLALARKTHLVSFLGMNLFTSSVVLFICALSDTLSDVAQEAKRGMARNLKIMKLLSGDGSLSMQCSVILEDLVQKIVDKEKEEMLRSVPSDDDMALFLCTRRNSYIDGHPESIVGLGSQSFWQTTNGTDVSQGPINNDASKTGGYSLQQSMASLQKVFKDVAAPRSQFRSTGFDTDGLNLQDPHSDQSPHSQQQNLRPEHTDSAFGGFSFNTEDLGQFWLWNMDPQVEDTISWQSGDDYTSMRHEI